MVQNHVHPPLVKGEYAVDAEGWGANTYDHPLHGLPSQRQAQPRLRAQKQAEIPIEQGEHYVAIVRGRDGRVHMKSSASLKQVKRSMLNKILRDFQEAVRLFEADFHAQPSDGSKLETPQEQDGSLMAVDPDTGSVSFPFQPRKRARANTESGSVSRSMERGSKNARVQSGQDGSKKVIELQLQDEEGLKKWYSDAFDAVQQVTCRTIAKLWIKKIEPKKQSAHPYNGGLPKEEPKNPERTKPDYWPHNIPHKEPDHIQKQQRICLLTHLITNTPHQQLVPKDKMGESINAAGLKAQSAERKNDFPPDKWEILEHIFRVRSSQEAYIDGCQDGTTTVLVPDCSKATRLEQGEPEKDVEDVEVDIPLANQSSDEESEETEHAGPVMLTPASSTMTSPIDQQRMQGHNTVTDSASSSFSNRGSDVISNHQSTQQQMRGYDDSFERSMAGEMMDRRATSGMAYAHHGLPQVPYSAVPMSQAHYHQQSMHQPMENHESRRWAEFHPDTFSHVPNMGAPAQTESVMAGYGIFSGADTGSMSTIPADITCTEEFYQRQARIDQMQRQLHHQDLVVELASQPPREIPYRTTSAQSAHHMAMSRHNSYDHAALQSSFYHNL